MANLTIEADAADAGLDAERLERVRDHLRRYVHDGRLAGCLAVVARRGKVVFVSADGRRDESGAPVELDTIWRIYSMTKPITSVAAMICYEEGAFDLRDPLEAYLPSFADARVLVDPARPETSPAREPVRIWHLLTHTAGLSSDLGDDPVAQAYRSSTAEAAADGPLDLAGRVDCWGRQPLLFEPGTRWRYSNATDVLGRLVEVVSGMRLDHFFSTRIFEPLGMQDTSFCVEDGDRPRLADLYVPDRATRRAVPASAAGDVAQYSRSARPLGAPFEFLSGSAGLHSTAADYHRFCQMVLGGGALDGARVLGPMTLRLMARNHLPDGADLEAVFAGGPSETSRQGVGFGLGFSVVLDPVRAKELTSPGTLAWGGAASTEFWIDPQEDLSVLFFTQLLPSGTWPVRARMRQLVYQAIVEHGPAASNWHW